MIGQATAPRRKTAPKAIVKKTVLYILMTAIAIVMFVPFAWMLSTSLKVPAQVFTVPPKWIPEPVVWDNYVEAWQRANFQAYFFNSVYVTACVVFGQLLTCSLAAFAFARIQFKGRDKVFLLYLATMMIPGQVTMIPNFILMRIFGWLDTHAALIVPSLFSAYGTFLLRQFFLSLPKELDEAAYVDGASALRVWSQIIVPLAKPSFATLGVFTFMSSWNSMQWPLIVLNHDYNFTLPLGLTMFRGRLTAEYNLMMAGAMICVAPVLVIYVFAQKYFIEGIAISGIKG